MISVKRVTINDIARRARVAKGTVSKVLNNKPGIGEETRKRVLDLVKELDYHPSSMAQALANQRTSNIGLVIPYEAGQSLNGSYWSALITSITREAARKNYNLLLLTPGSEGEMSEIYQSVLHTRRVDGLIISSEHIEKQDIQQLSHGKLPFILIGKNSESPYYSVDIDNHYASRSMTEHILNHGFRKVGFIAGPMKYEYNKERLEAYTQVLAEQGLQPHSSESREYKTESIYQAVDELLDASPELDAIFIGAGGEFLYDVLSRLAFRKIDTGEIGLAVFDDYRYLDFMEPRLTAVRQPLEAVGSHCVIRLLNLIAGKQMDNLNLVLPTSITVRGSCRETQKAWLLSSS